MRTPRDNNGLLREARVYLSGPMDFVASRVDEMKNGWRNRVGRFLQDRGVVVLDPWNKPDARGRTENARETPESTRPRARWTFKEGDEGARVRSECASEFWPALHIDLRMVDTSDFIICYCPTNIYSVGTPHEIILARTQRKPVLFVSPRVQFDSLEKLQAHLREHGDAVGRDLLEKLKAEVPIKENLNAAPSLWYMPLVGGEHFFDGFGFDKYRDHYDWGTLTPLEERERAHPPDRPLLPFLAKLNHELPKKWSRELGRMVTNDDWLLWDIKHDPDGGGTSSNAAASPSR